LLYVFIPKGAFEHLVNAKREILFAMRAMIDAKIETLEKSEGKKASRRRKVKVD